MGVFQVLFLSSIMVAIAGAWVTDEPGGQIQGSLGGIRLRGGSYYYGRVEVYYNGVWGTVCDDLWDIYDAHVACHQLGYSHATGSYTNAYYGQGSGTIWMDNVRCNGDESSLDQCSHSGFGYHDCSHYEDAGVRCSTSPYTTAYPLTTSIPRWGDIEDIRLVGGSSSSGRVEILYNGQWGTICHDYWSLNDAKVACRQLGFPGATGYYTYAYFGQGSGPIWMDNVGCYGYESSLQDCNHNGFGIHNCGHYEDAGVRCEDMPTTEASIDDIDTTILVLTTEMDDVTDAVLKCGSVSFRVDIPWHMVSSDVSASDLYLLGDPHHSSCQGFANGRFISLNSSLDGCGTEYSENATHSFFRNTVMSNDVTNSTIVEYLSLEIPITCVYERSKILQSHFRTMEDFIRMQEMGAFEYDFSIFDDISYSHRYNLYPVEVSLNTELFFRAELLRAPENLEIQLRSCRATPSPDYNDPTVYEFIRDGCGVNNAAVRVLTPGMPSQADFELTSFKFRYDLANENSEVWIHCDVIFCEVNDPESVCRLGCEEDRHRRSVKHPSQKAKRVVKGPLVLIGDGEVADKSYEKPEMNKEEKASTPSTILVSFSAMMLVVMVIMGVALLAVVRRLRKSEYQAVPNPVGSIPA